MFSTSFSGIPTHSLLINLCVSGEKGKERDENLCTHNTTVVETYKMQWKLFAKPRFKNIFFLFFIVLLCGLCCGYPDVAASLPLMVIRRIHRKNVESAKRDFGRKILLSFVSAGFIFFGKERAKISWTIRWVGRKEGRKNGKCMKTPMSL